MTANDRSPGLQPPTLSTMRKTALAAGILYLLTFASSIPAALLLGDTLGKPDYILGAGADGQIRLAAIFDIINGLTAIGSAIALYSIVKRQHEGLAIGFVASRTLEAAILFIGTVSVLSIADLRVTGVAADPASLTAVGLSLTTTYHWAFALGTSIPALNAVLLGWLMYRSRLVPRAIPVLGLIGAATFTSFIIGHILGVTEGGTPWHGIAVAPIFFWELSLGLWMTFKGFRKDAPLMLEAADNDAAADATSTGDSASVSRPSIGVASKAGAA
jgi:uncharacterized protein DUF4386